MLILLDYSRGLAAPADAKISAEGPLRGCCPRSSCASAGSKKGSCEKVVGHSPHGLNSHAPTCAHRRSSDRAGSTRILLAVCVQHNKKSDHSELTHSLPKNDRDLLSQAAPPQAQTRLRAFAATPATSPPTPLLAVTHRQDKVNTTTNFHGATN